MPRADITSDFRSDAGRSNFPKLRLQSGERARLVIVGKPIVEYVHWIEAPNIVNMAPVYKKIKGQNGEDTFVVDTRLINKPICFGAFEVLRERGVDDKACHACNMARERPDIFRPPQPRYAVNCIRYNLRPGGGWNDIANPYGVSALIWVFGGKVMDKLIDIRTMGPAYEDIRTVDLLISCDEQMYQKPYSSGEMTPISPAVWLANDATRRYTAEYLAQNGASDDDLTEAIGRRVKEDWMADDLNRAIQRWEVVRAYESRQAGMPVMGQGFGAESLQQGMGQLQQQYGGQGAPGVPNMSASGYHPNPVSAGNVPAPGQGFGPPAGVDMSLLGGAPAGPPAPAAPPVQQQPAAVAPSSGIDVSSLAQPAALAAPAAPAPATSPTGLAGLEEFMGATTQNPAALPEGAPLTPPGPAAAAQVAPALVSPPQQPPVEPPSGGKYSFEDLARMAGPQ